MSTDSKIMDRVRALLDQAEHPNTPIAEAEAFSEKAEALILKYSIDQAMLAARGITTDLVGSRTVDLGNPYADIKATLLSIVAKHNQARAIYLDGRGTSVVYGYEGDLDRVEMLFASLLVQAMREAMKQKPPARYNPYTGAPMRTGSTAAYRRSWLLGFVDAVDTRLAARKQDAVRETDATPGRGAELVLADRRADVDAKVTDEFRGRPLGSMRYTTGGGGRSAGHAAGGRADLGGPQVTGGRRRISR